MSNFKFNVATFIFAALLMSNVSADWSYKGSHGHGGVEDWPGLCNTGTRQSPVNIPVSKATKLHTKDRLVLTNYDKSPEVERIFNSGHSVTFEVEDSHLHPKISGGGLNGEYQFAHLHFHWGHEDQLGSEHKFDGHIFPMEMHLVHFNTAYGKEISEAVGKSDAWDTLAVIGVMFQVVKDDNHNFDHLIEELKFVRFAHQEIKNVTVFPLAKVLPANVKEFFRYNGSLTTPNCQEIVVWTMLKTPVSISENQLNEFRELFDADEGNPEKNKESDNFRGVQPLNDRTIIEYFTSSSKSVLLNAGFIWKFSMALMLLKYGEVHKMSI